AAIRLGNEQVIYIDTKLFGIPRIERVLSVNKGGQPAGALCFRNDLQGDGRLARGLRTEHLNHPATRYAAHSQCRVETDGSSGNDRNRQQRFLGSEPDNGPFSKLLFNLRKCKFDCFGALVGDCHERCSSDNARLARIVWERQKTRGGWIEFRLDCSRMRHFKDRTKWRRYGET